MSNPREMLATKMSEAEAVEGAKQGDHEYFERIYRLHLRRVYSLCLRMMRNLEEAEDLTQEAFSSSMVRLQPFAEIQDSRLGCIDSPSTLS